MGAGVGERVSGAVVVSGAFVGRAVPGWVSIFGSVFTLMVNSVNHAAPSNSFPAFSLIDAARVSESSNRALVSLRS